MAWTMDNHGQIGSLVISYRHRGSASVETYHAIKRKHCLSCILHVLCFFSPQIKQYTLLYKNNKRLLIYIFPGYNANLGMGTVRYSDDNLRRKMIIGYPEDKSDTFRDQKPVEGNFKQLCQTHPAATVLKLVYTAKGNQQEEYIFKKNQLWLQ